MTDAQRQAIVMFACKRSGHHGVLHWFCKQKKTIVHINNMVLDHEQRRLITFRPANESITVYGKPYHAIMNLEEISMTEFMDKGCQSYTPLPLANDIRYMVVLRRFKNMVASATASWHMNIEYDWDHKAAMYQEQLAAAQGKGHPLPKLYVVLFDLWFEFPAYRKAICKAWDIPCTDDGLNEVPRFLGSSFDEITYHGRAQEMKVLERWKQMENNPLYCYHMQQFQELSDESDAFFDAQRKLWLTHAAS